MIASEMGKKFHHSSETIITIAEDTDDVGEDHENTTEATESRPGSGLIPETQGSRPGSGLLPETLQEISDDATTEDTNADNANDNPVEISGENYE